MKGIPNIGNTCFINSVLQFLNSIDYLRTYLLSSNYNVSINNFYEKNRNNLPKNYELYKNLLLNLQKVFFSLNSNNYKVSNFLQQFCINMRDLAKNDDYIAGNISDFSIHNDAEEFLSFILDKIEDFLLDYNFIDTPFKEKVNNNIIINSFKIQEIKQYKCLSCNNLTKLNHNNYSNKLQLSINKNYINSLEDALSYYTLTNTIDEYNCEKCNNRGKAKDRTLISVLPNSIIIQLLRFNNDGTKINKSINIPSIINFDKFCYKNKNLNYRLVSVICHIDFSSSFGHYITITYKNNKWYLQDDETIEEITKEQANREISKNGYILIFNKI